jgi:Zn-dependent protease
MLLSFGVYWTMYGWKFAAGLIACIYVHEMGHVAALKRFGIPATAPMFIPGFGALVRLRQYPATPGEDARTGLAGPLWGLGATIICALMWALTGIATWAAIAKVSAWLNLFNLLPIWQLDGGRGFRALNKTQRWIVAVAAAGLFAVAGDGILLIIALAAVYRAFAADGPAEGDAPMLWLYIGLLAALSALSMIPSPVR